MHQNMFTTKKTNPQNGLFLQVFNFRLVSLIFILLTFLLPLLSSAQTATDNGCNYSGGWSNGSNNGSGFGAWSISPGSGGGSYTTSDGNINTNSCSTVFGIYTGGAAVVTNAIRPLVNTNTMQVNQQFSVDLDNGGIQNGGSEGLSLYNASGNPVFEFYFAGGNGNWTIHDNAGNTSSTTSYGSVHLIFTLTSATTYSLTTKTSATSQTFIKVYTGTLLNPSGGQAIKQFRFYAYNIGNGNNLQFNNLSLVCPSPTITTQPTAQTTCSSDGTASFTVASTTAATPTYQWRLNGSNLTNSSTISGATTATLSLSGLITSNTVLAAAGYDCVVKDGCNNTVTSDRVALTVNVTPSVTNATTATTCSGSSPNINLTASVASSFVWTLGSNTGSITGASASTGTSINQTLTNPSNSTSGSIVFAVTPTSTIGSCVGSATNITVTVNPQPSVATISGTARITNGASTNLSVAITGGTSPFTVVYTGDGGGTVSSYISGASITVSPATTTNYVLTSVTDANSCTVVSLTGNPVVTVIAPVVIESTEAAADNGCNYSGGWTNGSNYGTGFENWSIIPGSGGGSYTAYDANLNTNSCGTSFGIYSGGSAVVTNATLPLANSKTIQVNQQFSVDLDNGGVNTGGMEGLSLYNASGNTVFEFYYSAGDAGWTIHNSAGFTVTSTAYGSVHLTFVLTSPTTYSLTTKTSATGQSVSNTYTGTLLNPSGGMAISQFRFFANNIGIGNNLQFNNLSLVCPSATITTQPTAQSTCSSAGTATYTVASTSAAAPTYQWRLNGTNLTNSSTVSGATTAMLSLSGLTTSNTTLAISGYDCIVTDACGKSDTSNRVALTVIATPSLTTAVTASVCSSNSPNISLNATATSTFEWTIGINSGSITGASASSGTSINQTLTNPSNSSAGSIVYAVTPTSIIGNCVGSATDITVTVNPIPSIASAVTASICSGNSPNISLSATSSSSFGWTLGTNNGSITGASVSGGTSINQTLTNPSNSTVGSIIYVVTPTTTSGSCAGSATDITVTVNPRPIVANLTGTARISSGASTNLSVAITGGTSPFMVIYTGNGGGTVNNYLTGANISVSPASTSTYGLTSVTDANSCTVASLSGNPVVTVVAPVAGVSTDAAIDNGCNYTSGWSNGSNKGSGFGNWSISPGSGGGYYTTYDGNLNTNSCSTAFGIYTGGAAVVTNAIRPLANFKTIQVNQQFSVDLDNGGIQNGGSEGLSFYNASGNAVFEFYFAGGNTNWTIHDNSGYISSSTSYGSVHLIFTLTSATTYSLTTKTNATSQSVSNTYTGTLLNPSGGQAISQFRFYTYNIGGGNNLQFNNLSLVCPYASITTQPTAQTTCSSDGTTSFTVASTTASAPAYQWRLNGSSLTNSSTISGATTATLTLNGLTTSNTVLAVAGYDCVVTDACGYTVTSNRVALTVNVTPSVTNTTTATTCSGSSPNINLTASVASSFVWTLGSNTGSITGASASTGTSINQTLTNPSNSTSGSIVFAVTPTSTIGSCVGSATNITVTVNPQPSVATISGTARITNGASTNLSVAITGGTSPFTVVYTGDGGGTVSSYISGASITVSPATTTNYVLTSVTDANSCTVVSLTGNPVVTVIAPVVIESTEAAADNGCNYSGGWTNGSNYGTGFENWSIIPGSGGGSYTAYDANLNTNSCGTSFGIYSGGSAVVTNATLPLANSKTIQVNQQFSVDLDNGGVNTGGMEGLSLYNASGNTVFEFYYSAGDAGWTIHNSAGFTVTSTAYGSVHLTFVLTSPTTYSLTTKTSATGQSVSNTYTGTLLNPSGGMAISQFRFFANNIGIGNNLQFNNLSLVCPSATITTQPTAQSTCSSAGTATYTVASTSAAAPTYQWRLNGTNLTNSSTVSGATTAMLSLSGLTTSNTTLAISGYDCIVTDACGKSDTSNRVALTVIATPSLTTAVTASVCSSNSPNISLNATATSTFEWTIGINSGSITGASASSGTSINQTLTNPSNSSAGSIVYAVTPTSIIGNCVGSATDITVTVNPTPATAILTGTATITNGASTNLSVAITGGTSPFTVVYTGNGGGTVNSYLSGTNISVSPAIATTYELSSVTDAHNCTVTSLSGTAIITINPPAIPISASDNGCNYSGGWSNGSGYGTGFGNWSISPGAGGGYYTTYDANLNTNSCGTSFGIYTGGSVVVTNAIIPLANSKTIQVNQEFSVDLDNGGIQNGGSEGLSLYNASGNAVFEFYFAGGNSNWTIHDNAGTSTTTTSYGSVHLIFTLTSPTTYSLTTKTSATSQTFTKTYTGTLLNTTGGSTISKFRFYTYNIGGGNNLQFNNLSVICPSFTITTQPTSQTAYLSPATATFSVTSASAAGATYQWRLNGNPLSNSSTVAGATTATLSLSGLQLSNTVSAGSGYDCVVSDACGISVTSNRVALTVNITVPGMPVIDSVKEGNEQVSVYFNPPALDGGSTITSYTVTSDPGNFTATGTASPLTVTGLTNGTDYTFTVTATNAIGTGNSSLPSATATPNVITIWNGASWSAGAPVSSSQVIFAGNYTTSNPLNVRTITVNSGINVVSSGTITINGESLVNNGTISGNGSLILSGNVAQTISGIGLVANITINNTNGVSINSANNNMGITGLLTLKAGNLATNGNLTLKSTSIVNTATLAPVGINGNSGTISGTATVERYIPKGLRTFRDLGPTVYSAGSIFNNWQEAGAYPSTYGMYITGKKGVFNAPASVYDANTGFDYTSTGNPTIYTYISGVWTNLDATLGTKGTNLDPFQGVRTLIRGARNYNLNQQFPVMTSATTLRTKGLLVTGDVTFTTTGTSSASGATSSYGLTDGADKYSLIANPYPCPIDWYSVYYNNDSNNISSSYWYLDPTFLASGYSVYITYNAVSNTTNDPAGSVGSREYIQSGQGFFVQNNSAVTSPVFSACNITKLVIHESDKATGSTHTAVFGTTKPNLLAISLWKNIEGADTKVDGAVAVFNSKFTRNIGSEDSKKMSNSVENLSITESTNELCIDGLPNPSAGDIVALKINQITAGTTYQLKVDNSIYDGMDAYIHDALTNTDVPVTTIVSFTPTNDAATYANRFSIVFKESKALPVMNYGKLTVYPNPVTEKVVTVQTTNIASGKYNVSLINNTGQTVMTTSINHFLRSPGETIVLSKALASGIYTLVLKNTEGTAIYQSQLIINN